MQLPEYGCQFSRHVKENQEISCTKGGTMYGEWLALHQGLDEKLHYTFICIHGWNLSMLFKFWVVVTRTLEKTVTVSG